jgi:hypothetical protein
VGGHLHTESGCGGGDWPRPIGVGATCGDPTGAEQYPANPVDWQTFVNKPWARTSELSCPPESADYQADPLDIAKPKP